MAKFKDVFVKPIVEKYSQIEDYKHLTEVKDRLNKTTKKEILNIVKGIDDFSVITSQSKSEIIKDIVCEIQFEFGSMILRTEFIEDETAISRYNRMYKDNWK